MQPNGVVLLRFCMKHVNNTFPIPGHSPFLTVFLRFKFVGAVLTYPIALKENSGDNFFLKIPM